MLPWQIRTKGVKFIDGDRVPEATRLCTESFKS
jgi:hypothetical protein